MVWQKNQSDFPPLVIAEIELIDDVSDCGQRNG
jgi:hypothetical protein